MHARDERVKQWLTIESVFFFGIQVGFAVLGDCLVWLVRLRAIELHMGPRLMTLAALLIFFANLGACIGICFYAYAWWTHRRRPVPAG